MNPSEIGKGTVEGIRGALFLGLLIGLGAAIYGLGYIAFPIAIWLGFLSVVSSVLGTFFLLKRYINWWSRKSDIEDLAHRICQVRATYVLTLGRPLHPEQLQKDLREAEKKLREKYGMIVPG